MPIKVNLQKFKARINGLENNIKMSLAVIVIIILWMLSGIFSGTEVIVQAEKHIKHPKEIQAIRISAKPYTRKIILSATTQPYTLVNLAARTEGQIESISARRGDNVKKGALLLKIEKEQRSETLKTAQYQLQQADALFNAAKKLNTEGYRADTSLDGRRAELAKAKENLKRAENELSFTQVSSPIDGLVEDRLVEIGDYVQKGTPFYQLISKGEYKIVAYVSQKDRNSIQTGGAATAILATGKEVSGTINFIASNAHPVTHTYKIEVKILSVESLPTGMSAKLSVPTTPETAHFVPYVAMVLNDKGNLGVVILDETNTAQFTEINPLDDDGKGFYLKGLPAESLVVIRGQSNLIDGDIVIPHIVDEAPNIGKMF